MMCSKARIWLTVLLSMVTVVATLAQDTGRGRSAGPSRGSAVGTRSGGSSSAGSSGTSTVRSGPSRGGFSTGRVSTPSSRGRSRGTGIPVQTYTPNTTFNWSNWQETDWYLYKLRDRYRYLPWHQYAWRFHQGDSPLTQDSMRIALQECSAASAAMLRLSENLDALVVRYERGEISRAEFETQVEENTKRIRQLAKKIRKDDFLDYIDQRQIDDVANFEKADSIQGLRSLTQQLRAMAREVDTGLDAFHRKDMSRVVDVGELEQPSFDSLSKGIDRLAKTIDKSADRL